jgi:hypothetical protein
MSGKLRTILDLLSCPDDGQPLRLASTQLLCSGCGRNFPLHGEYLAEILPSRPAQLPASASADYRRAYLMLFDQQFQKDNTRLAWGAEETATAAWIRKRRRQVIAVHPLVAEGAERGASVLCDIAAGAGHYTFSYASYFRSVLHCDLSVENLSYASRKAHERNLENIFFLRIDYFQPPFRHSIDRLLCLDTLIRGEGHDSMLLKSIGGCLTPTGSTIRFAVSAFYRIILKVIEATAGPRPRSFSLKPPSRTPLSTVLYRNSILAARWGNSVLRQYLQHASSIECAVRPLLATRCAWHVTEGSRHVARL